MRIWTTQSEEVVNIILRDRVYRPDFDLSHGLGSEQMKEAYKGILGEYKERNNIDCRGLVYGISHLEDKNVKNIEQYRAYFENNKLFWDSVSMAGSDYAVLELEISDGLDLLPLYFQDFIVLAMRAVQSNEFRHYVKSSLKSASFSDFSKDFSVAQQTGWTDEYLLNRITQVQVHEILLCNIKGVYETYNFDEMKQYSLGINAEKLKAMVC